MSRPARFPQVRQRPRRGAAGFTLVELLLVMVIISILAGLALPHLRRVVVEGRAADAVEDLEAIRAAVLEYQAEHGSWPDDVGRGQVPDGLGPFLPEGFRFRQDDYVLDYDNWSGRTNGFVGVTVITTEQELGQAMLARLGNAGTWTDGRTKLSWVLEWG